LEIRVYGAGCPKCRQLERLVREVVAELELEADIQHVHDLHAIADAGFFVTPGLTVDGQKVLEGKLPSPAQLKTLLAQFTQN